MVISLFGGSKCGLIAQPTWVGRAVLMRAISARFLMACKAERFTIGRCITSAFSCGRAVMRLPCSALSLFMVFRRKLFAATLTLAVGVVEDFALSFVRKSHCRLLSQEVSKGLPFGSNCSGQVL